MPTLTIKGTISFPLGAEANPPSRPFGTALVYAQKQVDDVVIVGAQVNLDLMGRLSNAKAAYIEVVAGIGEFKINGAATTLDTNVGGYWLWFNLAGGLTALTVTTTDSASFRVYLFS